MGKTEREATITDLINQKGGSKRKSGVANPAVERLLSECTVAPQRLVYKGREKERSEVPDEGKEQPEEPAKVKYDKKNDPRIDRTLFVGNVTLHISEKELLQKLEIRRSEVESLRFRSLPIHPKFASNKKVGAALECFSGKSSTKNAYIVLKDESRMKQIIDKFSGSILAGNSLRLTPASKGNQFSTFDRKRTVFVGGLPKFCTEDELRKFVTISLNEDCVSSVRIIKSATTGKPKGFGFVLFNDRKFVASSVRTLNGAQFKDSCISVTRALSEEEAKSKNEPESSDKGPAKKRAKGKPGSPVGSEKKKKPISKRKGKGKVGLQKKPKAAKKSPKFKKTKPKK
ncbi:Nop12p nucleolar protein [Cryptosporidium canis]|uniref:Nop12p nucleolar protein n=1 Tax=Cryptosporidium canis TaxID=195482 RepID=A0ABQ8PBQ0_9CRYT|nr:Nop12p nucleolar protein [Cryptosporidium canis]KAJ1615319.1 Nop12p nucleolar protein [Cryptosporidium canis]